jgi:hypothetical integral membrane protein (TIGR02206 family)
MRLFGLTHVLWILGTAAIAVILTIACKRRGAAAAIRAALAITLASGELIRCYTDGFPFPYGLPFNLCNVSAWVAVLACITLAPSAIEFVYFNGIAGAGMAMLTPDMGHDWPVRFFVDHGALVIAGIVLARLSPLRRGAMWRAYGLLLLYGGLIGIFDWAANANFAYLRSKPPISALSVMGPWPVYIIDTGIFALFLFWLLSIPVRQASEFARSVVLPPPTRVLSGL